jgi:hypothetical protein
VSFPNVPAADFLVRVALVYVKALAAALAGTAADLVEVLASGGVCHA